MEKDVEISVLIPCYEMNGLGGKMLSRALDSIALQRKLDETQVEIVISDHSRDKEVELASEASAGRFPFTIRYYRNERHRGSSSRNLNFAFRKSSGRLVKILFQDDFLIDECALWKIKDGFDNSTRKWLACGATHTQDGTNFYNPMVPFFHPQIHLGRNTMSSPSVIALRREAWQDFDTRLIWLMDVDFYKRMFSRHGESIVLSDILVANGVGSHQVTHTRVTALRRYLERGLAFLKHCQDPKRE